VQKLCKKHYSCIIWHHDVMALWRVPAQNILSPKVTRLSDIPFFFFFSILILYFYLKINLSLFGMQNCCLFNLQLKIWPLPKALTPSFQIGVNGSKRRECVGRTPFDGGEKKRI
jgi:hypothetical protein